MKVTKGDRRGRRGRRRRRGAEGHERPRGGRPHSALAEVVHGRRGREGAQVRLLLLNLPLLLLLLALHLLLLIYSVLLMSEVLVPLHLRAFLVLGRSGDHGPLLPLVDLLDRGGWWQWRLRLRRHGFQPFSL